MKPHSIKKPLPGPARAVCLAALTLGCASAIAQGLEDGLISYWPLDDVVGTKTPDLISGYDMELVNLSAADLVPGKVRRAFHFENANQTMLKRENTPGELLPVNQHAAVTIAMWAKVAGTGLNDLRLFSESSRTDNNPLFNIGTASDGATGKADLFFRQTDWTTVDHLKTEGEPLDGTWHHIAFVQQEDGTRTFYIDGVPDPLAIPAKEAGDWRVTTTTIGGILRANPTHWVTGELDEVMAWSRALTEAEVQQVVAEGLDSVIPPITRGMVAYWPLDEVTGVKTPDLANGYDMELVNLTDADLVPGRWGNGMHFENANQTMLKRENAEGEQLPINQFPALSISLWTKVNGTGLNDLRIFSESSRTDNNPLFNIGTASDGATGKVDFYLRQTDWTTVDHLKTEGEPLDGAWHHLVLVQQEDGSRAFYIDGVPDPVAIPAKEAGDWRVTTTTIGGILRANPTHWLTGDVDDVALYNRALEPDEITELYTNGTTPPYSKTLPLAVRSFKPDLPAVAVGDTVRLTWDVTKNVQVRIDPGVGDVTAQTVSGLGAIEIPVTASRTYTLTLTRGAETTTATTTVAAIDQVAEGWTLLDNFDRYEPGLVSDVTSGIWADLDASDLSIVTDVVSGSPENRLICPTVGGDAIAVLQLGRLAVNEGLQRTLFFRFYTGADEFQDVIGQVAITDRPVRFGSDVGANIGPGALVERTFTSTFYLYVGAYDDSSTRYFDFNAYPLTGLDKLTVYNVWVDITNGPFEGPEDAPTSTGDTYSIYVQKEGDATRTLVIDGFTSTRDPVGAADTGFTQPDLTRLIVGSLPGHADPTLDVVPWWVDDIYLSQDGFNATVPRPYGYTIPVEPNDPPVLSISRDGGDLLIEWTSGSLESSASVTGPYSPVAGAVSPYRVQPTDAGMFFRGVD